MAGVSAFVVSPVNARKQLSSFIKGAKKRLFIYDPEISDAAMIRLLEDLSKGGVEIRILGHLSLASSKLDWQKLGPMRWHTRTMIRDGQQAFIGSQSLREIELGARPEVGVIFCDAKIVSRLSEIFLGDWDATVRAKEAKKIAKAVVKDLPPVAPVLEVMVEEMVGERADVDVVAQNGTALGKVAESK